ncbi:HAD family phosphatase [Streptomyces sp. B1866]|uniref:HAD family hydrolase n=1 Tax=Streptomyces sp. B1866 TaxID=3075431 RepID=UPI0028901DAB|nr:HAD family phosphatase [Streptomyces sp. B1866]MDT3398052.1 HAD family phosphatase [Streptomyces sp. B1866]
MTTTEQFLAWTPAAVVFDCDGTLMDTERHWEEARELVLRGYGVAPDPEFAARTKGLHYTECGQLLAEAAQRPDLAEEMTAQLLQNFRRLVAKDPVTTPGAEELVRRTSRFAPLAVASNCPLDVVESCLDTAGLLPYFAHIVVPGEGVLPKPHPDVYLTATSRCGAPPADSLAVEDSRAGLQAAARAGLSVLGVGPQPSRQDVALADMWVRSLGEPDLLAWAESRVPRQRAGDGAASAAGGPNGAGGSRSANGSGGAGANGAGGANGSGPGGAGRAGGTDRADADADAPPGAGR